jgi:glycosyltransferase involved in cell wall biosynthesis
MNSLTPVSEKSSLKILMTDASPNWGGQQYRLVREADWLRAHGHEVTILCGETSKLAANLKRNAHCIHVEKVRSWGSPRAFLRFAGIIRHSRPGLIHTRSGQDSTWGSYFYLAGWPVVCSRHTTIPERVPIRDAITYRFGCSRIIAAAHSIKRDLVTRLRVSDSRIDVVGEGADLEEFHPGPDGGGFRAEFKIPPKSPLFGVIGAMRPEKGQRTFINAAAKVLRVVSDARFVIVGVGGGSYVDRLYEKIRRNFPQSPAPIIITGYREDLSQVMGALDFVVVPSLDEAQTIIIPQAFAAGKPVIASQVGGIPELVRHEQNGLLVQPCDNDALAAAMLRLLADPALSANLASAGLSLARRELSFEGKAELVLESYLRAIDQHALDDRASADVRARACEPLAQSEAR